MTFYRQLYRNLLFPFFDGPLKRRRTTEYWRQAEESQWWEYGKLAKKQLHDLQSIVEYAYRHCPYYRDQWIQRGLEPIQIQSLEDFRRWPVLSREEVGTNREGLKSSIVSTRLTKSTGGSTGEPLVFDLDLESDQRRTAMTFRGYDWGGVGPGTRRLLIWGVDLKSSSRFRKWKIAMHHRFNNELVLNCFDFSRDTMPDHFQTIERFRPQAIIAYTSALYEFALFLREKKLQPNGIRSILVGAEKLHSFQRELIEEVFRAPLFESYGSREFMLIGSECEQHQGLHLSMENLLVEILDDQGQPTPDGQQGNVVVTDLFNRAMPFIRYRNGDLAIAGFVPCSCGRGLPLLKQVIGRQLDVIMTPSGKVVPGEYFPHFFKDYPNIRRFQVLQNRLDQVEIRLVLSTSMDESFKREIQRKIGMTFGSDLEVQLREVDAIPLTRSGKLQVVVNQLNAAHRQS